MKTSTLTKKITTIAILISLACIFSLFDSYLSRVIIPLVPLIGPLFPNIKLGISNIIILIIMYKYSFKETLLSVILKSVIIGLIFSGPVTFIIGFSGGILSFIVMYLLKKALLDIKYIPFISFIGGVVHILFQSITCFIIYGIKNIFDSGILLYLPILLLLGAISGVLVGIISKQIIKKIKRGEI